MTNSEKEKLEKIIDEACNNAEKTPYGLTISDMVDLGLFISYSFRQNNKALNDRILKIFSDNKESYDVFRSKVFEEDKLPVVINLINMIGIIVVVILNREIQVQALMICLICYLSELARGFCSVNGITNDDYYSSATKVVSHYYNSGDFVLSCGDTSITGNIEDIAETHDNALKTLIIARDYILNRNNGIVKNPKDFIKSVGEKEKCNNSITDLLCACELVYGDLITEREDIKK